MFVHFCWQTKHSDNTFKLKSKCSRQQPSVRRSFGDSDFHFHTPSHHLPGLLHRLLPPGFSPTLLTFHSSTLVLTHTNTQLLWFTIITSDDTWLLNHTCTFCSSVCLTQRTAWCLFPSRPYTPAGNVCVCLCLRDRQKGGETLVFRLWWIKPRWGIAWGHHPKQKQACMPLFTEDPSGGVGGRDG